MITGLQGGLILTDGSERRHLSRGRDERAHTARGDTLFGENFRNVFPSGCSRRRLCALAGVLRWLRLFGLSRGFSVCTGER